MQTDKRPNQVAVCLMQNITAEESINPADNQKKENANASERQMLLYNKHAH